MGEAFEQLLEQCEQHLRSYKAHLDIFNNALPHPITLKRKKEEWMDQKAKFERQYNEAVTRVREAATEEQLQTERVQKLLNDNAILDQRVTTIINNITQRLEKWEGLQGQVDSIEQELNDLHECIEDIPQYEGEQLQQFFQAIKNRNERVRNQSREIRNNYDQLTANRYVKDPPPQLAEQAASDHNADINKYNDLRLKLGQLERSWAKLNVKIDKERFEHMENLYEDLGQVKERVKHNKQRIEDRRDQREKDGRTQRPLLEEYQALSRELSSEDNALERLNELKVQVPRDLIITHPPVRDFLDLIEQLCEQWRQLKNDIENRIESVEKKVRSWEAEAFKNMQCDKSIDNGRRLCDRQQQTWQHTTVSYPKRLFKLVLQCLLMMIALCLLKAFLVLHYVHEYTWYVIFYHLQLRLSFIELDSSYADYS